MGTSLEHAVCIALEPREEISKEVRENERKEICSFKPIRRTQHIQIGLVNVVLTSFVRFNPHFQARFSHVVRVKCHSWVRSSLSDGGPTRPSQAEHPGRT